MAETMIEAVRRMVVRRERSRFLSHLKPQASIQFTRSFGHLASMIALEDHLLPPFSVGVGLVGIAGQATQHFGQRGGLSGCE